MSGSVFPPQGGQAFWQHGCSSTGNLENQGGNPFSWQSQSTSPFSGQQQQQPPQQQSPQQQQQLHQQQQVLLQQLLEKKRILQEQLQQELQKRQLQKQMGSCQSMAQPFATSYAGNGMCGSSHNLNGLSSPSIS